MDKLHVLVIATVTVPLVGLPRPAGRVAQAAQNGSATIDDRGDLAQELQDPVADLISIPFPDSFEFNGGADDDTFRYLLNIQPVIPLTLNRTITPVVHPDVLFAGRQTLDLELGGRCWTSAPRGVSGWAMRFTATLLFPG